MGSRKKKQSHGHGNDSNTNRQPEKNAAAKTNDSFSVASLLVAVVAICIAVAFAWQQQQQQQQPQTQPHNNTSTSKNNSSSNNNNNKVFDEAAAAARAAQEDPLSVEAAQAAAQAYFLEGHLLKASKWTAFSLRRQALQVGAEPPQAQALQRFQLLHFLQHLEVNVIMMSKLLLQQPGGPMYAQQLEQQCHSSSSNSNSKVSQALSEDPTSISRTLVANLVVE